ncbi:replication initiation protein, partial [Pseudoalteromonas sp. S1649]
FFCSGSGLANSVCGGTIANGYVRYAVKLPSMGDNYISNSKIAELAGRTYDHSQVKNIIVDAYQALLKSHP